MTDISAIGPKQLILRTVCKHVIPSTTLYSHSNSPQLLRICLGPCNLAPTFRWNTGACAELLVVKELRKKPSSHLVGIPTPLGCFQFGFRDFQIPNRHVFYLYMNIRQKYNVNWQSCLN